MAFINPAKVVDQFDVLPAMKVADFGSGSGYFSMELAKRVGGSGVVYAFDVQKEALSGLKSMATSRHISNIETALVDLESANGTSLDSSILDFVLISNMLFQAEDKKSVVEEAFRVLKKDGKICFIDYDVESTLGPPKEKRISKSEATNIFTSAGFIYSKEINVGENHYGLIFSKKG